MLSTACLDALEPRTLLSAAGFFQPVVSYPGGYQPDAIAVADFNHDGVLDIVTANASSTSDPGSLSLLLGNTNGTFQTAITIPTDIAPTALVVGHFNNDAYPDLAVACYDMNPGGISSVVDVFLGQSDGSFIASTPFPVSAEPRSIASADFNGDGYDDLAVSSDEDELDQNLSIFLANSSGSGDFTLHHTYASYSGQGITTADFNGDHLPDLAVLNQQDSAHNFVSNVTIFTGQSDGTFFAGSTYVVSDGVGAVASADFNHDGHADLVITCFDNSQLNLLLGAGDGTFGAPAVFDCGRIPRGLAIADFNSDGNPDVAVASWANDTVCLKFGDGAGGFLNLGAESIPTGIGPYAIASGDFNRDGRTDLVTADELDDSGTVSVLLGAGLVPHDFGITVNRNATFTFSQKPFLSAFSNTHSVASVKIVSLPGDGVLSFRNKPVTVGQVLPVAQLSNLRYRVNRDFTGIDSFSWQGFDGTAYSGLATVQCVTTPEATISAGPDAYEGNPTGTASSFTIVLNHSALTDLTISVSASGHAVKNTNYIATPKNVTIPAGATSVSFAVTPLLDGKATGDLNLIEKLSSGKGFTLGAAKSASLMIIDEAPKLSITAADASASFGGSDTGAFTIALSHTLSSDLVLTLVFGGSASNGKNYQLVSKTLTIPAGQSTSTLTVTPSLNPSRNKTVTLTTKVNKSIFSLNPLAKSATVTILHTI